MAPRSSDDVFIFRRMRSSRDAMRCFIDMVRLHPRIQAMGAGDLQAEHHATKWWFALDANSATPAND